MGQHHRLQVKAGVGQNHRLQVKAGVGQNHRLQVKAAKQTALWVPLCMQSQWDNISCSCVTICAYVAICVTIYTKYMSLSKTYTCHYLYLNVCVTIFKLYLKTENTTIMETRNYLFMLAQITAIHLLKTNFHTPPQIGESKPLIFCHRIVPQSGLTFYPTTSELVAQKPKFQICGSSLQHSNGRSHNLCKRLVSCHDQTFGGSDWNPIFSENILQIF